LVFLTDSRNLNPQFIHGHHIRLKGITEAGLKHTAKTYSEDGKTAEYFKLYEDFAINASKKILLNPFDIEENEQKALFEFKLGRVSTRTPFYRTVKF